MGWDFRFLLWPSHVTMIIIIKDIYNQVKRKIIDLNERRDAFNDNGNEESLESTLYGCKNKKQKNKSELGGEIENKIFVWQMRVLVWVK